MISNQFSGFRPSLAQSQDHWDWPVNVELSSLALILLSWLLADFDFASLFPLEDIPVPTFLLRFLLLLFFEEEDPLPFPLRLLSELSVPFLEFVLFEEE